MIISQSQCLPLQSASEPEALPVASDCNLLVTQGQAPAHPFISSLSLDLEHGSASDAQCLTVPVAGTNCSAA